MSPTRPVQAPAKTAQCVAPTLLAAILSLAAAPAAACGAASDCDVGNRTYRILDPGPRSGPGAIVFFHGVGGTASQYIDRRDIQALVERLRVPFVGLQSAQKEWNIAGAPSDYPDGATTELTYVQAVMDDLEARHGIDRDSVLVAGFSSGAMAVSTVACVFGEELAAGYAPMSGEMWTPLPERCPGGPVSLIHYHGTDDTTVPMAGRTVGDSRQGDILDALDLFAAEGSYADLPRRASPTLDCTRRGDPGGRLLELCMFDGGHAFDAVRLEDAWHELGLDRLQGAADPANAD